MSVMTVAVSLPRRMAHREGALLVAERGGQDLAVAVGDGDGDGAGAFERFGKIALCPGGVLCHFGDDCVGEGEARRAGSHHLHLVREPALHEGIVVGYDGSLVPCRQ